MTLDERSKALTGRTGRRGAVQGPDFVALEVAQETRLLENERVDAHHIDGALAENHRVALPLFGPRRGVAPEGLLAAHTVEWMIGLRAAQEDADSVRGLAEEAALGEWEGGVGEASRLKGENETVV